MDRIARAVEPSLGYRHQLPEAERGADGRRARCRTPPATSPRRSAREAIVVPTFTGRTASAVARLRPRRPIVGLIHHQYALQQMALEWGVTPLGIAEAQDVEELWSVSLDAAREAGSSPRATAS